MASASMLPIARGNPSFARGASAPSRLAVNAAPPMTNNLSKLQQRLKKNKAIAVATVLTLPLLTSAATLYWDSNGSTTGAGVTPTGTWGVSAFWSTSSTGVATTANTTTTALDTLTFSAGTDAVGSPTVTVSGTQNAQLVSIEEGAVTFSGGTLALGGATRFGSPAVGI